MKSNGKNKRWTAQEAEYVQQNLGKVSFEDMAASLGRSPMSVRLFVLRRRMTTGSLVKRNLLMEMLKLKFRHHEEFTPTRAFYKELVSGNAVGGICTTEGNQSQERNTPQWRSTWV